MNKCIGLLLLTVFLVSGNALAAKTNYKVAFICSSEETIGFVEDGHSIRSTKFLKSSSKLYLVYDLRSKPGELKVVKDLTNKFISFGILEEQVNSYVTVSKTQTETSTFALRKGTLNYIKTSIEDAYKSVGDRRNFFIDRGRCMLGPDIKDYKSPNWVLNQLKHE